MLSNEKKQELVNGQIEAIKKLQEATDGSIRRGDAQDNGYALKAAIDGLKVLESTESL